MPILTNQTHQHALHVCGRFTHQKCAQISCNLHFQKFGAEVTDRVTGVPVAGVEVDVQIGQGKMNKAFTGSDGTCNFKLPQPKPATVHIFLSKDGYERDEAVVPADMIFKSDMVKLP